MALVLKNLQKIVKLNMSNLERDILILRHLMSIDKFDVSVLFVNDDYIRKMNEKYRLVEGPTDVLAFPAMEIAEPGVIPVPDEGMDVEVEDLALGDVLLAPAYIRHHCQQHNENFNHVLLTTVTHGLCHLIGHDHETEDEQRQMFKTELSVLDRFNRLTGYSCRPLTAVGH